MTGVTVKVPLPASVYGYVDGVDGVVVGVTCCVTFYFPYFVLVGTKIVLFSIKLITNRSKLYFSLCIIALSLDYILCFVFNFNKFEFKLTCLKRSFC